MIQRIGILALAAGLAAAGMVLPAAAQTTCRLVQISTMHVTNPVGVTPLDAIAFPATLTPRASTVVRQTVICPAGSTPSRFVLAPVLVPAPGLVMPPVFLGAPAVVGAPLYPYGDPYAHPPSAASTYRAAPYSPAGGSIPTDTVGDLAANGSAYDRAVVTVGGTVADVRQTADAADRPLTAFQLQAQGAAVNVIVWGRLGVAPGEQVRVSGPFYVSSPFTGRDGRPWHNAIEAQTVDR